MKESILRGVFLSLSIVVGTLFILGSGDGGSTAELKLEKTGQTVIYEDRDDGYYQWGMERNFTRDDARDIVIDNIRGAMWQDDIEAETKTISMEPAWSISLRIKAYCSTLRLGGYIDWRVPRKDELLSIAYFGEGDQPIDPIFKHVSHSGDYWCKTDRDEDGFLCGGGDWHPTAMHIDFSRDEGVVSNYNYNPPLHIRCVRGMKPNIDRFERVSEKDVVIDRETKLMWMDSPDFGHKAKIWKDAIEYCETVEYAGYGDWRLPNIMELFSIIDTGKCSLGTINKAFLYVKTRGASIFSSTTNAYQTEKAYVISFGVLESKEKEHTGRFLCVRSGINIETNNPPEAIGQELRVEKNSVKQIHLTGIDPDNDPLTFIITVNPKHGMLDGTPPDLNYTPDINFTGLDFFSFKVNDGVEDSEDANVTLTVYATSPFAILKTGQQVSYRNYDDGFYEKGAPRDFVRDAATQIVTDQISGLMWQDSSDAATFKGDKDAAVLHCGGLRLGGYDDWRVPSVEELMTLVNWAHFDPAIEPEFEHVASDYYMTSTRDHTVFDSSQNGLSRWVVDFLTGVDATTSAGLPVSEFYVRCVRGTALAHHSFTRNDTLEVVVDNDADLMWEDGAHTATTALDWAGAIDYCENLTYGSYSDWRAPNFNELYSIWDRSLPVYDASKSAIDPSFKNVSSGAPYWTSTTSQQDEGFAWSIFAGFGSTTGEPAAKSNSSDILIRCVRDTE